jgi:drug/metabolite transporter (DMT)-like permease
MTPPRQVEHASVRSPAIGITAAFAAAAIAAGWQVATRAGLTAGGVTPIDLALFRYGMPALVLLPLLVRNGLWPSAASRWLALPLCVGGLPFGLLAMCGAQLAPVAHMGALLPGTMPLFTALLAWLLLSERLALRQMAGFLVVSLGIALITHKSLAGFGPSTLTGDLLFLLAALAWAVFTITFRVAGIPPWHAAALISLASALVALPLWFATGTERLLAASPEDLLWLVTMQGLLAGLAGSGPSPSRFATWAPSGLRCPAHWCRSLRPWAALSPVGDTREGNHVGHRGDGVRHRRGRLAAP